MKSYLPITLAVLAIFVAVSEADDDHEEPKRLILKHVRDVKDFFTKDPLGKKFSSLSKHLMETMQMARMRLRGALKKYLKSLLKEDDKH